LCTLPIGEGQEKPMPAAASANTPKVVTTPRSCGPIRGRW
jgi:hypothetical protein